MSSTRWLNFFAFLWFVQFLFGCQNFVIAGAVSKWFFTRNKSKLGFPILISFGHLIRYHLGSVCLGSLLIAIIQFIRTIFKLVEVSMILKGNFILKAFFQQSTFKESSNPVSVYMLKACQCFLACFESFLQYLGKNAYIIITMDGSSFCTAGKRAFKMLSTNSLQVLAINSVGDFVLLLGKVFVVLATVLIGIELIQVTTMTFKVRVEALQTFNCFKNKPGLHYTSVPVIICGVFAFLVCHCFLTVYEMTIDTIFLCFCEDCERNDGIARPYYMSRGLMEFVQNSKLSLDVSSMKSRKDAWAGDGNMSTIA